MGFSRRVPVRSTEIRVVADACRRRPSRPAGLPQPPGRVTGRPQQPLRILVVSTEFSRALIMAGVAVVVALDGPPVVVLVLVALSYVVAAPIRPALSSIVPSVAGERHLAGANAVLSTLRQIMTFVGPLGGRPRCRVVAVARTRGERGVARRLCCVAGGGARDPRPIEACPIHAGPPEWWGKPARRVDRRNPCGAFDPGVDPARGAHRCREFRARCRVGPLRLRGARPVGG